MDYRGDCVSEDIKKGISIAHLARAKERAPRDAMNFIAARSFSPDYNAPSVGAQFAEVEVNTETGHVRVIRIVAVHDIGRVINPTMAEGQIEGAIHMGLGYALSEELVMENGYPKSTRLRNMGILRAKEMPEVEVIGVEEADPYGPYGAKGVGEIGLVPTAAAVANALFQFDHQRRRKLPMQAPKK